MTVELSWVLLDRIVDGSDVAADWVEVITRHRDRFVVGTDTVGRAETVKTRGRQIRTLLGALPVPVAHQVAVVNAERLWFPP